MEKTSLIARQQKKKQANINHLPKVQGRTGFQIVRDNVFTYFNFLNLVLFVLVIFTGSYRNAMFMGVVIFNAVIGIFQEFYLKYQLDKLKTVRQKTYTVVENGIQNTILSENITEGMRVLLSAGDEVPCDIKILETDFLEVNESLLTGEADPILKGDGEILCSGSFIISGTCIGVAIRVGEATDYAQMLSDAGCYRKRESQILKGIEKIIRTMSLVILPLGIVLFLSSYFREEISWREAVLTTTAGIVGMIPSGLYLITTITAGTSVLKLARKKALVNDFTAIECLSRVTTLCLDKTGTLTTGEIRVKELIAYQSGSEEVLKLFSKAFPVKNPTLSGIFACYGDQTSMEKDACTPFSSQRKYSQVISDGVCYRLGAPEQLVLETDILFRAEEETKKGNRVLALCKGEDCMALIVMRDVLRPRLEETLQYFRKEQVELKIISGDHPVTVSQIANQLGFSGWQRFLDIQHEEKSLEHYRNLVKQYCIFGRVGPEEKKLLVQAMQQNGEVVCMVGDGVNDVPALGQADLSVAMSQGDQATKSVSRIVLSESDFTPVPAILKEGRRIVNNIERVASLYLLKTGFSLFLSMIFILLGTSYPFAPISMTVIGTFAVGIPSFFLALEPNDSPVSGNFMQTVFYGAIPTVVIISLFVGFFGILEKIGYFPQKEGISFYLTAYFCFLRLIQCSLPFTVWKVAVVSVSVIGFFLCVGISGLLGLPPLRFSELLLLSACLTVGTVLLYQYFRKQEGE